jgi:hypothetical protein
MKPVVLPRKIIKPYLLEISEENKRLVENINNLKDLDDMEKLIIIFIFCNKKLFNDFLLEKISLKFKKIESKNKLMLLKYYYSDNKILLENIDKIFSKVKEFINQLQALVTNKNINTSFTDTIKSSISNVIQLLQTFNVEFNKNRKLLITLNNNVLLENYYFVEENKSGYTYIIKLFETDPVTNNNSLQQILNIISDEILVALGQPYKTSIQALKQEILEIEINKQTVEEILNLIQLILDFQISKSQTLTIDNIKSLIPSNMTIEEYTKPVLQQADICKGRLEFFDEKDIINIINYMYKPK